MRGMLPLMGIRFSMKWLLAAMLYVALAAALYGQSAAAEPSNAPFSIEEIIRVLKAKEDAIETLQVTSVFLGVWRIKPGAADERVYKKCKAEIAWEVTRDGAARMTARVQRTDIGDDNTTSETGETILSTWDGARGHRLRTNEQLDGRQPEIEQTAMMLSHGYLGPFDVTTRGGGFPVSSRLARGVPISNLLADGDAKFIESQQWEDRTVVVLEAKPKAATGITRLRFSVDLDPGVEASLEATTEITRERFWVDVDRGVVVRRQIFVQHSLGNLEYQIDATQYTEVAPGIWLPGKVDALTDRVESTEQGKFVLRLKNRYAMTGWIINKKIDTSRFNIDTSELPRHPQPVRARIK